METTIYNVKNFLLIDLVLSGLLCTISALLIVLIFKKRQNLSNVTKYLLFPLLIFAMNKLLTDAINFNNLLKMYNPMSIDAVFDCYAQKDRNFYTYIISFVALIYVYIFIDREETKRIEQSKYICKITDKE